MTEHFYECDEGNQLIEVRTNQTSIKNIGPSVTVKVY